MRLRHTVLATTLLAGMVTTATAQEPDPEPRRERRARIWIDPGFRRPFADTYRFRMNPERMRNMERALERAGRVRMQSLNRLREREFAVRDRVSERVNSSLRRSPEMRERTMDRVRERMNQLRDQHRYMIRRRLRTL